MRVKIVDAWSWGLPVLSTAVGAEGINTKDGEDILLADSLEKSADAVLMLLQFESMPEFWQELGENQLK
jgi:hypothetical protein